MLEKPEILIAWENAVEARPQVCWNCEWFSESSYHCGAHDAEPPAEFAATDKACSDWLLQIPF